VKLEKMGIEGSLAYSKILHAKKMFRVDSDVIKSKVSPHPPLLFFNRVNNARISKMECKQI